MTSRWWAFLSMALAVVAGGCGNVEHLSPVPTDAGSCPADCDDGNACTDDTCDSAEGCAHVANALACDDGDACTVGDACAAGECTGGGAVDCDDGNACTDDACEPAEGCTHAPNTSACDDGDACTVGDVCAEGACEGGGALDCDDGNACTDDTCDSASGCSHASNVAPCDDGDACTVGDACAEGACTGGVSASCNDGIACTVDSCDALTGCAHTPDDDVCDDVDGCTDDVCDTITGCLHIANVAACDDGDPCTTGDVCQGGQCTSEPIHVVETALGYGHGCAVKSDGSLWCWGLNSSGQLGDGTLSDRRVPVMIEPSGVVSVGAGFAHTCMLRTDGSVWCWGYGAFGAIGYTSPTPILFNGVLRTDIAQLTVGGGGHTCALTTGGELWCWGSNGGGQVGDGTQIDATTPLQAQGLPLVASARAGESRTCAVDMQGGLWCWGYAPLGDGTTVDSAVPMLIDVAGAAVAKVAVGGAHTCAMTTTSELYCWGDNYFGSVGTGTSGDAVLTPQLVSAPGSGGAFVRGSLGTFHTCALAGDGTVWCWGKTTGSHDWGLLLPFDGDSPTQVQLPFVAKDLWAGGDHACAAATDGTLSCWGWNEHGDLGDGEASYEVTPTLVAGLNESVVHVAAGGCQTCAIGVSGLLYCWGTESSWDCGSDPYLPLLAARTPVPLSIPVASGVTPIKVAVGGAHACAVMTDGTLWCWGENWNGQLAQTPSYRADPTQALTNVSDVCAGGGHTCALLNNATVWCWGASLGAGTAISQEIPTLKKSGIASLTCGGASTCALDFSGKLWCWGLNTDGQLGTGDFASTPNPTWVSTLGNTVLEATAGAWSTCARTTQGLSCWGDNFFGKLGIGASNDSPTPLPLALGSPLHASVGGYHACAIVTGSLTPETWCWGYNAWGVIGDGTTESSNFPVASAGPSMLEVAAGGGHVCAVATDGMLWCWGDNFFGQVGTGTLPYAPLPTTVALTCP